MFDTISNGAILQGLRRQKELIYAGLSTQGTQSESMAKLIVPKRQIGLALNMRNSSISEPAIMYLSTTLANPLYYITALNFKFCYLTFDDIINLSNGLKFNKTVIKLDLSNNGLKACVVKFLLEALLDNYCLAELNFSGNFLDNEFIVDLAHLLESNQILHTVDISRNPIGPEGSKFLLASLLQYNDTLESLGEDLDSNMYMGVRTREELK